jgi:hypothetical protein
MSGGYKELWTPLFALKTSNKRYGQYLSTQTAATNLMNINRLALQLQLLPSVQVIRSTLQSLGLWKRKKQ